MSDSLAHLFSPIDIGSVRVKNRIVSTGHHTYLADKQPGDALIAYHEARARGGAGLIVSEIVAVHETAGFSRQLLSLEEPTAEAACVGAILLVHAFRRVVLRDPQLPGDLLADTGAFARLWARQIGPAGGKTSERQPLVVDPMPL